MRIRLVELCFQSEQLSRIDVDLSVQQGSIIELGREPRRAQHLFLLLVEDQHIVDDDAVEKAQVHPSHGNGCTQFLRQSLAHAGTHKALYGRNVQQYHYRKIEDDHRYENSVDDVP